jgi:electron transfer flavoprotein beta subunit
MFASCLQRASIHKGEVIEMNIFVPIQLVPDLVEELIVAGDGRRLDPDSIRWLLNEFDDHAIEEAILLKEKHGGKVTILAPDFEGVDDVLYQAVAKGADRVIKLSGELDGSLNTHALARLVVQAIQSTGAAPDLILTGVQTHDSLDGALGPLVAAYLDLPLVDCVARTSLEDHKVVVHKEFPGGLIAETEVTLPAVLGIQAADTPPRYVPISKIRQAMKACSIETKDVEDLDPQGEVGRSRMYVPELGTRAEMIEGSLDEVADRLAAILKELVGA